MTLMGCALQTLGITQSEFARIVGIHRRTVNAMACGRDSTPADMRLLLLAIDEELVTLDWLRSKAKR